MNVIEVIPLTRGSHLSSLTYYSSTSYEIGSIIKIPVRNKEISGLVTSVQTVSAAKTAVRAATFSLRKLPEQSSVHPLPPGLIETAKQLTKQYPATLGAMLFALLPEEVRSGNQVFESSLPCIGAYEAPIISILQATSAERMQNYRSRIREAFAHRGSVLFVVPTSAHIAAATEALSQGISERIVSFSTTLSTKKLQKSYDGFHDLSQAKLIITTPSHAFLDRHDITHIIIDESRSPYYKSRLRPYLDVRDGLKVLGKISGRQLIMGDLLPRTEDEHYRREGIYLTEGEHPKRLLFDNTFRIIKQSDKPRPDVPFELFSPQLLEAIENTLSERRNIFLYSARRGIAPVVVCVDCGYIFRCPDSGTPYSLLRTMVNGEEKRWFLSSTSGKRLPASDVCPDCGSWRLKERGIGIQHIYDELCAKFSRDSIVLFDHTTATTARKAQILVGNFYEKKGCILLGTSMAISYLEKPVALSAIVSLDAARAIPSWRAEEEFFALLLTLRERSHDSVIVQTRSDPDEILTYAKAGQIEQFYNDELELRQALKYPPYSVFVHLTIQGSAEAIAPLESLIKSSLEEFSPRIYPAPQSRPQKTIHYALMRIPAENWPNPKLMEILRSLPPSVRIEINPGKIV